MAINIGDSLQWRHNRHEGVPNQQPHDCLPSRLFKYRSKKSSKRRATGLCAGNSPVTGEFPAQRASSAENDSIWWRGSCGLLSCWYELHPGICARILQQLVLCCRQVTITYTHIRQVTALALGLSLDYPGVHPLKNIRKHINWIHATSWFNHNKIKYIYPGQILCHCEIPYHLGTRYECIKTVHLISHSTAVIANFMRFSMRNSLSPVYYGQLLFLWVFVPPKHLRLHTDQSLTTRFSCPLDASTR